VATLLDQEYSPSVAATMQQVLLALIPGAVLFIYYNGWGVVLNLLIASASALACEAIAIKLRNRSIKTALSDCTALVTAILIGLCLPPLIPWYVHALAGMFAILFAKHMFGGLGYNLFNPAMVGYALVLVSFPEDLSLWLLQPDRFSTSLPYAMQVTFNGGLAAQSNWDALTGATALDLHRDAILQGSTDIQQAKGILGAKHSEWINLAYLIGGLWMLGKRIISWHIPVTFLLALTICTVGHKLVLNINYASGVQLLGGATILGAFFIATDPVSAAVSNRGKIIYAALAGILVYAIRAFGAFPDSVAFAVLLANCAVPLIDRMEPVLTSRKTQ